MLTESQAIKSAPGELHSLTISWRGATAGDIIAYFLDATSDTSGNPATHKVVIIAGDTNGTFAKEWPQGKRFDEGIYYKEGMATNVYTELTYK